MYSIKDEKKLLEHSNRMLKIYGKNAQCASNEVEMRKYIEIQRFIVESASNYAALLRVTKESDKH